jgi:hypothetical protein
MQKPQIALLFVIPADQQASRAIEPTMRALQDPALCRETGLLLERFGLFPRVPRWAVKLNSVSSSHTSSSPLSRRIPNGCPGIGFGRATGKRSMGSRAIL